MHNNLERFITAQQNTFEVALSEIKKGQKQSYWMWYIFPQFAGLGFSSTAKFYEIKDMDEANAYFSHQLLGNRLIKISTALLAHKNKTVYQIFGTPDDLKLKSCMTLFNMIKGTDPIFQEVLTTFFNGEKDIKTLQLLKLIN